jgi:opacity protein-like surface antigen
VKEVLLIAILVTGLASFATAQVSKPFEIYVGGGVSIPSSTSFNDEWNTGFNGMAAFGLNIAPVPGLKALAKAQYHRFQRDVLRTETNDFVDASQDLNMFMFGVDGLFRFGTPGGPFSPYSSVGIGVAHSNFSDLDQEGVAPISYDSQTDFYFNLAAGLEFRASPGFDVFIQATYINVSASGDAIGIVPITVGVKF